MGRQISPLRYPGGKAKLYPYVSKFISENFEKPPVYCEPFAGGFGLGISLLLADDVSNVILNDNDYCIFAFWNCVVKEELFDEFLSRIINTEISINEWKRQKQVFRHFSDYSIGEVGFATFYLNRCNRSGILEANPIGGMNQNGKYTMDCRFHKDHLIRTISKIHEQKDRIRIYKEEALTFLPLIDKEETNMLINLDPPYFTAGPMLYKNNYTPEDHVRLAKVVSKLNNRWIMTYDDTAEIRSLYNGFLVRDYRLNYSLASKKKATELIIYDRRFTKLIRFDSDDLANDNAF